MHISRIIRSRKSSAKYFQKRDANSMLIYCDNYVHIHTHARARMHAFIARRNINNLIIIL